MNKTPSFKVCLFLGAGASAPLGLPVVTQFFTKVSWQESYRQGTKKVAENIWRRLGYHGQCPFPDVDSEDVFSELSQATSNILLGRQVNIHRGLSASGLLEYLTKDLVRIYSTFEKPVVEQIYSPLFQVLNKIHNWQYPLRIFTTNYDTAVETILRDTAFCRSCFGSSPLKLVTGFTRKKQLCWTPEIFERSRVKNQRNVELLKLHGSVNWVKEPDAQDKMRELSLDAPAPQQIRSDALVILYFGYKGIPEKEPFRTLHDLLKQSLLEYDLCIAIGFRFADPYIRELFDVGLRANKYLKVVCVLKSDPPKGSPVCSLIERHPNQLAKIFGVPFGNSLFHRFLMNALDVYVYKDTWLRFTKSAIGIGTPSDMGEFEGEVTLTRKLWSLEHRDETLNIFLKYLFEQFFPALHDEIEKRTPEDTKGPSDMLIGGLIDFLFDLAMTLKEDEKLLHHFFNLCADSRISQKASLTAFTSVLLQPYLLKEKELRKALVKYPKVIDRIVKLVHDCKASYPTLALLASSLLIWVDRKKGEQVIQELENIEHQAMPSIPILRFREEMIPDEPYALVEFRKCDPLELLKEAKSKERGNE